MAQIKISQLTTGTPQGTDETPATDPLDTTQAASGTTKKFIRSAESNYYMAALGVYGLEACRVAQIGGSYTVTYSNGAAGVGATLTNAGAQSALVIDGVTCAVNDRVLIQQQASPAQNGIYTVTNVGSNATNWVLTRATDYDESFEIETYRVVRVNEGFLPGLSYYQTQPGPFTIGTTPIEFSYTNISTLSFPWVVVTTSQTMSLNTGYIANGGALVTLQLPAVSEPGDQIAISGYGAGGFLISQTAGQQIQIGNTATTVGAAGSVASTNRFDSLRLVCVVANTIWTTTGGVQSAGLTIV